MREAKATVVMQVEVIKIDRDRVILDLVDSGKRERFAVVAGSRIEVRKDLQILDHTASLSDLKVEVVAEPAEPMQG